MGKRDRLKIYGSFRNEIYKQQLSNSEADVVEAQA